MLPNVQAESLGLGLILWYECLAVRKEKCLNYLCLGQIQIAVRIQTCGLVSVGLSYQIISGVSETQASIFYSENIIIQENTFSSFTAINPKHCNSGMIVLQSTRVNSDLISGISS